MRVRKWESGKVGKWDAMEVGRARGTRPLGSQRPTLSRRTGEGSRVRILRFGAGVMYETSWF